jgi:hypothetical protein
LSMGCNHRQYARVYGGQTRSFAAYHGHPTQIGCATLEKDAVPLSRNEKLTEEAAERQRKSLETTLSPPFLPSLPLNRPRRL